AFRFPLARSRPGCILGCMIRVMIPLGAAHLLPPLTAAAQEGTPLDRVVHGVVFDSVGQQPLGGVTFYFDGRKDEFASASGGQFRIAGVRPRDSVLVLRRIGFVPLRVMIPQPGEGVAVDLGVLRMKPVATKLDRIAVEAEEVTRFPLLADFYRRKQNNTGGSFITREDIERSGARKTSE